jgi:PAS domain S-box-containing protein
LGEQRRHARERSLEAGHETRELNSFFTIFHDLHSITDRLGYFWWLNGAWEKMLGYSRSELLATPFMELIHREDVTATRAAYADLIAGRNITNFVNRCRYKDGTYRWFEWSAVLGNQMVYCSGRDITERKRAEADLREAFNEIKKLKDQLTRDRPSLIIHSRLGLPQKQLSWDCP